jgi:hypothetical protein
MDDLDEEFFEIIAAVGPRRRGQIVTAARALADDIRADADHLGTAAIHGPNRTRLKVLGLLPQQTFGQSRFWRYQLAGAAEALAGDTDRWGAPVPRCTGEEMVLHLTLHRAAADAGCLPQEVFAWPEDPTRDHGWGDLFEYLFQDHDVLMLYDVPEYGLSHLGAVNIEPRQWFTEFSLPYPVPERHRPEPGDD